VLADDAINIPILCYHNFNPTKRGSMNMTPQKFEAEINILKDNGFTIIPLQEAVEYLQGKRATLPPKSVVISFDDGWKSVYTYILPIVKKYNFPATLFIYPQTISEGKNALTWDELKELTDTGLFDVQGHTYDHPNFKHAKKRMSAEKYAQYVTMQLAGSKKILEEKTGKKISYLAWPFGIYDDYLQQQAANAGYVMAFTIDALPANRSYKPMSQPRFMIIDGQSLPAFTSIVNTAKSKPHLASANNH
jgi:peptidoglycan/xylan/chitin deacetylase (PgdA/CDA1 family)